MNGEPAIGVKAPLEAMVATLTVVGPKVACEQKRSLDLQLISTSAALVVPPWAKGEPGTEVSAPVGPILNIATEFELNRATLRNLPLGVTLIPSGVPPAGKGEPVIAMSAPFYKILKAEMLLEPASIRGVQESAPGSRRQ